MNERKTSLLFVCMGNICRSPLAECVFRHKARQRGVERKFHIDSAGTGNWHAGEPPDQRVCEVAKQFGIEMCGKARQITTADFSTFDLFLCADESNRNRLLSIGSPAEKTKLLLEFDPSASVREVPDPYFGGDEGFMTVYRLVDSACEALLDALLDGTA